MSSTPTYGPFSAGPGRSVGQDDYLDFIGPMLQGDGVNSTDFGGSALQVYADNSGLTVRVRPGSGMVRGAFYQTPADVALTVAPNGSSSTRVDRVVLSMNRTTQAVAPVVITGTPGAGVPAMTRTVGGTWQIPLAQVQVSPGAGGIAPGNVSDDRQFLPLKILVANSASNSSTPLPPPDGTAGRIVYDRAVGSLLVTDGFGWRRLYEDSGVQNLLFDGRFWDTTDPITGSTVAGPQYQKLNGVVDFRCSLFNVSSFGQAPVTDAPRVLCTLPAGSRPSQSGGYRRTSATISKVLNGEFYSITGVDLNPATGVVTVYPMTTQITPGYRYDFNFSYIAGS